MPRVHLPDGRIVNFPYDMTPEQIQAEVVKLIGSSNTQQPPQERSWTDTAVDALPTIGGAIGGLAGIAGGPLGSIGGAALGGAGGEGFRQTINALRGQGVLRTPTQAAQGIVGQAATQGAADVGGQAIGGVLRTVGRGLYRAGALPINQVFQKYGDVIKTGIQNRVPVSKGGYEKAGRLVSARTGEKAARITDADTRVSFNTAGVVDDAMREMQPYAERLRKAGLGDPLKGSHTEPGFASRAQAIVKENAPGLKPSGLEEIKGTIDDTLGPAYQKLRKREMLTPTEKGSMELSQAMSRAQESVVPNYRQMNRGIMDAVGLQKVIGRRTVGSGGNQGLENALTMAAGPSAIPARLMLIPGVASRAGIASHVVGERPAIFSNVIRAALLGLMSSHDEPQ